MSAIYGVVGLEKEDRNQLASEWKSYYNKFKIDRNEQIITESAFFGCGIQYFNKEAEKEQLPIWNAEKKILFTTDCVLDNREELIEKLEINNSISDGEILYQAYLTWGEKCLNQLRGCFSFVAYHAEEHKIILAVDHFSQRCLFYKKVKGGLYFSTLLMPISEALKGEKKRNDRWLIDAISLRGPAIITEPKETALQGVYKVVSGTYVVFDLKNLNNENGIEIRYFDPNKTITEDSSITIEKSEVMVKETMKKIVRGILREGVEVAAQLSMGLDSTSVVCTAAPMLAEKGKKLYTFTSVPLKEAGLVNKGYFVNDESEGIEEVIKLYPNIESTLVDSKKRNYLLEVEDMVKLWELPCKSQQNAIWVDEIFRQIEKKGCKIMLNGGTGNCTLSAGSIEDTALNYLKHGNIVAAYKTLQAVQNVGASRKKYLKILLKGYCDYYLWYFKKDVRDCYVENVTRYEVGERVQLTKRFHRDFQHRKPIRSKKRFRYEIYMPNANAQIGEIDTKYSLRYGVLSRDPMRTVEMMELCFSLPMQCFAYYDYDRRLVREGMKGIVPEKIRHDVRHRGRQSADNLYRAKIAWPQVRKRLEIQLDEGRVKEYLDEEKIKNTLKEIDGQGLDDKVSDVMLMIDCYSFANFLEFLEK